MYRCIILSGCSSPGFMNELSLRQRLGDGIDPTVMSLQKQGEEREHYETSHSFSCLSLSPLCPPPVLLSCDGLILQAGESSLLAHSPLTHPGCSLAIFPSPALPCPAQPCLFQPHRLWPQSQKFPISRPRSCAQAKKAANLVHVYVCINVCQLNSI